jgi:hypothetical protein
MVACLATTAVGVEAEGAPTAEEVRAQIAQLEAEYSTVAATYQATQLSLAQTQTQLNQTTVQLTAVSQDIERMSQQVTQIALHQWQDHSLSQSLLLFTSPDTTVLLDRLSTSQQVDHQILSLLADYEAQQSALTQLRLTQESALASIAAQQASLTAQQAELDRKQAEARNLLATVVSPRNVGVNNGLTPHAIQVKQTLAGVFPSIVTIGGYRAGDWGDHGTGRALDVMIPNWSGADGIALGDDIARWCQDNAKVLGVSYLIWRQRYWQVGWGVNSWQWMADRGSSTQNHYDHVHISLKT